MKTAMLIYYRNKRKSFTLSYKCTLDIAIKMFSINKCNIQYVCINQTPI